MVPVRISLIAFSSRDVMLLFLPCSVHSIHLDLFMFQVPLRLGLSRSMLPHTRRRRRPCESLHLANKLLLGYSLPELEVPDILMVGTMTALTVGFPLR